MQNEPIDYHRSIDILKNKENPSNKCGAANQVHCMNRLIYAHQFTILWAKTHKKC